MVRAGSPSRSRASWRRLSPITPADGSAAGSTCTTSRPAARARASPAPRRRASRAVAEPSYPTRTGSMALGAERRDRAAGAGGDAAAGGRRHDGRLGGGGRRGRGLGHGRGGALVEEAREADREADGRGHHDRQEQEHAAPGAEHERVDLESDRAVDDEPEQDEEGEGAGEGLTGHVHSIRAQRRSGIRGGRQTRGENYGSG